MEKEKLAIDYFYKGYNCGQALLLAFKDELKLSESDLERLGCNLGGGVARLRELCGCISSMSIILGYLFYKDKNDYASKSKNYYLVQKLAKKFKDEFKYINCHELLNINDYPSSYYLKARDKSYYENRPCVKYIGYMADLIEKEIIFQNKLRIDYLKNHEDYKVVQHEDMYHFNTDTCLLGEFIKIKENETVLDVGCNNGALLVYASKLGGIVSGIEINKDAIEVCNETLLINNIKANIINDDFNNLDIKEKYDVIVSNPPYFNSIEKEISKDFYKAIARHEGTLTLDSLSFSLKNHLKENGRVYLVYRNDRFKELEEKLNKNDLYINKYQLVYEKTKNVIKSVLVEVSFANTIKEKLDDLYI